MELVKGGSLTSYLVRRGLNIQIEQRLRMARDASLAIKYIHRLGVIHWLYFIKKYMKNNLIY